MRFELWMAVALVFVCCACSVTRNPPERPLTAQQQMQYEATMKGYDTQFEAGREAKKKEICEEHSCIGGQSVVGLTATSALVTFAPTITTTIIAEETSKPGHYRDQRAYVQNNYDALTQEMAQGRGDSVHSLFVQICPYPTSRHLDHSWSYAPKEEAFDHLVQQDFDGLVPLTKNPDRLLDNVRGEMGQREIFRSCRWL